jgi:NAD(P)-dependent dehydrogenase (short-subunit alcohol dehydrogenase family)
MSAAHSGDGGPSPSRDRPELPLPSFRLDGKLALVTGASRGIGRGCALGLAAAGADIAVLARHPADLESVAAELAALGAKPHVIACDVTATGAAAAALAALPRLDILVNNAGGNQPQSFLEVSEEVFDRLFALNVKSAFFMAQAAARRMREEGVRGSIVNMSSQAGHVALKDRTVYCATKHAMEGFSKAMAIELAPYGIRVNTVAPTFIETPMTRPFFAEGQFADYVNARIPLGRVGTVEDVVGAVLYLASPAAALVTGTSLRVDGGWTAQ